MPASAAVARRQRVAAFRISLALGQALFLVLVAFVATVGGFEVTETRISSWYLRPPAGISRSQAPASAWTCMAGTVSGHPNKANGERVTTSAIVRVDGRRFWTRSGNAYVIEGDPLPKYVAWLKAIGRAYDPQNPIGVIGGGR